MIDWAALDVRAFPAALVERARAVWAHRVESEFRSIQMMTRFLGEILAAGDPPSVYVGAAEAIRDEIRHTELCAAMVRALGGRVTMPAGELDEHREYLELPMAARALATGVSMLAISETVSTHLIADLRDRCHHPTVRAVLEATIADEDEHRDYGWGYVRASLARFDESGRELAMTAAEVTIDRLLREGGEVEESWSDEELAPLGMMTAARETRLVRQVIDDVVAPRLADLFQTAPSRSSSSGSPAKKTSS